MQAREATTDDVLVAEGCSLASKGNPVRLRDCPAAVNENETGLLHWSLWGWEAAGSRNPDFGRERS